MKEPKKKISSSNKSNTPFFNKSGEQSFFAQSQNTSSPFFNIQPKLTIGQPNDKYEKEADQMADRVVGSSISQNPTSHIQRKCSECENEEVQAKPLFDNLSSWVQRSSFPNEEERVQAKSNMNSGSKNHSSFESQLSSNTNLGAPLSGNIKQEMETSFGADFNNVRIHNNSNAASLSQKINAQAFTHGSDIYFNQGKFAPSSKSGKHLLAHELTHTIQQGGGVKKKLENIIQKKCGDAACSATDPLTPSCPNPNTFRTNPKLESIRQSVFESASNYDLLEKGDSDDAVILIQQLLLNTNCIGFDRNGLRDEMSRKEFGHETDRAVRQFQSGRNAANGQPLGVDGDVGPGTLSAMDIELNLALVAPAKPPEAVGNCFGKAKHGPGENREVKPKDLLPIPPFIPVFAAWEISNFDIDKHFLKTEHRDFIRSQIIPKIKDTELKYPTATNFHLRIIGEASTTGGNLHNLDLSARRANCTAETLVKQGVDHSLIKTPLNPEGERLAQIRRELAGLPKDGVEDRTARKVTVILDLSSENEDCSETDMLLPSQKYLAKIACAGLNIFRINIGHFENPVQPVYREFLWTPSIPFLDDCLFQIPQVPNLFRPILSNTELQLATKNPTEANAPSSFQGAVNLLTDLSKSEFKKTSSTPSGSPYSIISFGSWNSISCLSEHQDTSGFLRPLGPVKCGIVPEPPKVDDCYPSLEDCPPETRQAAAKEYTAHIVRLSGDPLEVIKLIKKLAKVAAIIDKILSIIGVKALLGGAIVMIGSKDLEDPIMRTFIFAGGGFSGSGASSVDGNMMFSKKFSLESPKQLEKSSSGLLLQDSDFEGTAKLNIIGGSNKEQLTINGNGFSKTIDFWGITCDGGSTRSASGALKPITNAKCKNLPVIPTLEIDCKDDCSDTLKLSEFHRFKFKTGRASFSSIPIIGKKIASKMGNCGATLAFINIGNRPQEGETEIYRKFLFIAKNDPCKFNVAKSNFTDYFVDPKALAYKDPNDITSFSDFAGFAKVDSVGFLKMIDFPPTNYNLPGNYETGCKDGNLNGVVIPLSPVECGTTPEPSHFTSIDPDQSQRCEDFKTSHLALVNRHVARINGSYKPMIDSIPIGPELRFPMDSYRDLFTKIGEIVTHGVFAGKTVSNVPVVSFITFRVNKGVRLPSGFYVFDITVLDEPCSFDALGNPTLILPIDCKEGYIGPGDNIIFPIRDQKKEKPSKEEEKTQLANNAIPETAEQNGVPAVQTKCSKCEEKEVQPKRIHQLNLSAISDSNSNLVANDHFEKELSTSNSGFQIPEEIKQNMEANFNMDFNMVRIHTDNKANRLNHSIGARAFTHGSNIFFNKGEFNPGTKSGDHLLAHELTHVVQQSNGNNQISRAIYRLGTTNINVAYDNILNISNNQLDISIQNAYQSYTGLTTSIIPRLTSISTTNKRRLLYAIDLLSDNQRSGFDKENAITLLLNHAGTFQNDPLTSQGFRFEEEVMRVTGWSEKALTKNLTPLDQRRTRLLQSIYNPSRGSSSASSGSSCPTPRSSRQQLNESRIRRELPRLITNYLRGVQGRLPNVNIQSDSLPNLRTISDIVQSRAKTFFSPYIGRSSTRMFTQNWNYSAHLTDSSTSSPELRKAFIANRARSIANNLFAQVHFDSRCNADNVIFNNIIDQIDTIRANQTLVNNILSWQNFTAHDSSSAEVTINLQYSSSRLNECQARWIRIETLCHELMHVYVDQRFHNLHRNRQIIKEGFTEILGDQLYDHIQSTANQSQNFRNQMELGLNPQICARTTIPDSNRGYGRAANSADLIRRTVGDNRFRAAYFLGQTELAALLPKLKIGGSDNPLEQEADQKADQVVQQLQNKSFRSYKNQLTQKGGNNQIQRRALPEVIHNSIGNYEITLPQSEAEPMSGNITAIQEITLSQEDQGTFIGFQSESTAQNVSRQNINQVNAIIQDDQNRYHVYKTNLSSLDPDVHYQISPFETHGHIQNIYFENLAQGLSESNRGDWVDRARLAANLRNNNSVIEAARIYTQLVAEATSTNASQYHIVTTPLQYQPGLNFSIHMIGANGRGGIRSLPSDRSSEIPNPVLVIGASVFNRNSPDDVRSTFFHELTHYAQAQRSIELLQIWRITNSRLSFQAWLNLQERQGKITSIEHSLTLGFIHNNDDNTETLAHLNAFILSYPNDDLQRPDSYIFRSLHEMTDYWLGADRSLEQLAINRIFSFYQNLDFAHQDRLANYIEQNSRNHPDQHRRIPFQRLNDMISN